jgi:hypothetical protein
MIELAAVLALSLASAPAADGVEGEDRSPASDVPASGVVRAALPFAGSDGAPVARVFFDLRGGTGSEAGDLALRARIEAAIGLQSGDAFSPAQAQRDEQRLRALPGVREAGVTLFAASEPGQVIVVVAARLVPEDTVDAAAAGGFPVLSESDAHLLRMSLSGGAGVFSDYNPWFASAPTFTGQSPIALAPPGPGRTTWTEASVEFGLAGAVRLGETPATAFAELTGVASASAGNDLFRDDTRFRNRVEKAYAGLAWVDRANQRSLKLSGGRQNWQLYGGFLFSRFAAGANAGPHPGLYLSPRTTYQQANLFDARWRNWRLEAFELDPAELDQFDSRSRFTGYNLRYQLEGTWEAGFTQYQVPESRSRIALAGGGSVPRQGQRTMSGRLGVSAIPGLPGWELLGEYARQDSVNVDWDADAWYAQVRYRFDDLPWKPNITYRRARFSGDKAGTTTQEAFDAPLSSGLDEWVQGISFKKVVTNSNLDSHRWRLNLGPDPRLNYTIDYFRLYADQVLPGQAAHYGDELDVGVRWSITPRLFFLGVAGIAWPGDAIRDRTGGRARPWSTVQASLFWGF